MYECVSIITFARVHFFLYLCMLFKWTVCLVVWNCHQGIRSSVLVIVGGVFVIIGGVCSVCT